MTPSACFGPSRRMSKQNRRLTRCDAKTFRDPDFAANLKKLIGIEPDPLFPEEQAKVISEIPRDPQAIEIYRKIIGGEPLPTRSLPRSGDLPIRARLVHASKEGIIDQIRNVDCRKLGIAQLHKALNIFQTFCRGIELTVRSPYQVIQAIACDGFVIAFLASS